MNGIHTHNAVASCAATTRIWEPSARVVHVPVCPDIDLQFPKYRLHTIRNGI